MNMNDSNELSRTEVILRVVGALAPDTSAAVTLASDLRDDLGYHSLALVELSFLLEDIFSLEPISREVAELVRTVGDIDGYIHDLSEERGFVFNDGGRVERLLEELEGLTGDW